MRRSSVCDIGMIGPPNRPCMTRNAISIGRVCASPHSSENRPKPSSAMRNTRTAPKREASQPVSGTQIASATEYEVITQVPCDGATARLPEMWGTETLAIVMSSTTTKFDRASANAAMNIGAPVSGASVVGANTGAGPATVRFP